MRYLFIVAALVFASASFAQKKNTATADPLAGIDTLLERILKERKGAGFAVAVVNQNKILYAKGFGYRDYEKKLPVTPNTLFAIGSCTKAFTSLLIGLLEKEGKLDLNKPARTYLPELKFFNSDMDNGITVKDMMSHRTGLPRHDYSWYLFNTTSRDSMMQRIQYQEPTAPNRQRWQYNNYMFLAQGVIAEKLTGKTWEENIREKIFKPLGMTNSNVSIPELKKSAEPSLGYRVYKDSIIKKTDYYDINAMSPAGSINSSVNEMAQWVMCWINGGKHKGEQVFPANYIKEAMSSQMVIHAGLPIKERPDVFLANYGYGWFISSYRGHYRVEHGGNIDGFSANTAFFPTDSIGIIVLANQDGSAINALVRNSIADRLLKEKPIDWLGERIAADAKAKKEAKENEGKVESNRKPNTKPSHFAVEYEGLYSHSGYGTAEVVSNNDSIFILFPDKKFWLRHYHYDVFEAVYVDPNEGIDTADSEALKIRFDMNEAGDISALLMQFETELKPFEFVRRPRPQEVSKDDLKKFEGAFELGPGAEAKFYIKGEKTLYAFIEGQPEYELVATGKNTFALKALSGYSVKFEDDDKGEIIAVSFIQPNGTFRAKKKN